jgi:hypothetical protein
LEGIVTSHARFRNFNVSVFTVVSDPLLPSLQTVRQLAHCTAAVLAYCYELQKGYMAVLGCQGCHPNKQSRGKCLADALNKYGDDGDVSLETEYKTYSDPAEVDEENRFDLAHLARGIISRLNRGGTAANIAEVSGRHRQAA